MTTSNNNREAEELLRPHSLRVMKRYNGFTEEKSVVDYWDAVDVVAAALSSRPTQPTTDERGKLIAEAKAMLSDGEYHGSRPERNSMIERLVAALESEKTLDAQPNER